MFEICTMTSAFSRRRDGSLMSYPEAIRRCEAAGFDVLDLSIASIARKLQELM